MKKWMLKRKSADFDRIANEYGISPITARVMRNRDVISDEEINKYLNGTLDDLYNPMLLKDMDKAADIICKYLIEKKKIRVVGDYDIDGVCSTAILVRTLRSIVKEIITKSNTANSAYDIAGTDVDELVSELISYRLPDRITDGYGINTNMIDEAIISGVELIITCDNGIAAYNEIEYAKDNGITVVVTDHHEVPIESSSSEERVMPDDENTGNVKYILPPADAVVDPHRNDCEYPFKEICGGMVAYKTVLAVLNRLNSKILSNITFMEELVSLAAFATIGDIMPLRDENRIIVKIGLELLKHTSIQGLSALIDVTEVNRARLSAYTVGFVLGPCINAIGRLDSATKALEMILSDNYDEALPIAKELKAANDTRKAMMERKIKEASDIVINGENGHNYINDTVLVIYLEDCHESIAGLVASRIKERFYKPVIVITDAETGAKGSGRSIDGYDMFAEMSKVKHLFTKFGGHKMAAGLSLPKENIDELRTLLNNNSKLTEDDLIEKLSIDIDLPINYVSKALVEEMDRLAPFGTGNPGPLFAQKDLTILSRRASKNRNMVFFNLKSGPHGNMPERIIEAKYFGDADEVFSKLGTRDKITIAYTPDINSYMGVETLQVSIKEFM